tara:strand:+ start:515 stop:736 length:222 start_codon:yes stop_codon:yes gene_type:complete
MKVNEVSEELQNLILKYYDFERNNPFEEDQVLLTLNMSLHNVRYELMQNYHYDSFEDRQINKQIIRQINTIGV